ncbi:MAG: hypothetical protein A2494_00285 [Candidatus Lloydbacteria bacterium RIFOXYC12_FULL_46_25]|uniref:DUF2007 domain-containing protein n=1 Tax=Candidatus Lloydbacteria bacterium RIFOXYC12_FULL_46_25 TaxID=1798670 RepID=A0A1G2DV94_9BACT|nr:MAG: hypothetical protein A2494_00285 [Candidatus Lloydbacteria bacterium RIFOXYC12_FULL_46_25]
MSTRIKFFREQNQAHETQVFLNTHAIKSYIRTRTPSTVTPGEEPYGFDLFVLRDDDVDEARQVLNYEFGSTWGEAVT